MANCLLLLKAQLMTAVYRKRWTRFINQCVCGSDCFGGGNVMVWMQAKEEHGCDSGSEILDKVPAT
jgi:hypothetical protein